ncbi:PH domain-containing protein [Archangium minus]|uniref:PH domain-containing protein n=1 Tax=Archangium minus TaxID=83450 RepID=UPI0037BFF4BD
MPAERQVEPAILQALDEVQDALRTEQRAQGPLSGENARLRARLEQLQAERVWLRLVLEELAKEKTSSAPPRLAETLEPPFEVQGQALLRRRLSGFLSSPLFAALILAWEWDRGPRFRMFLGGVLLLVVAVQCVRLFWNGELRWSFKAARFEGGGWLGKRLHVNYSDVVDVQVHVSPSQQRRGVGTVVVTYRPREQDMPSDMCVLLKDVPEPERLAAWLRAEGSGRRA